MLRAETKIRVRYAETDQMGYVYYGNYAAYFEVGRVEALRKLGTSYRKLEESGTMLPVIDFQVSYLKPAFYDDELTIVTYIKDIPRVKITFYYEIYNEDKILLNKAHTTLVFINKQTNKISSAPDWFIDSLKKFLD
jgi:acyl-CoA thioester hydrolase